MVTTLWTVATVTVAVLVMSQGATALQCYHCYVKPPPRAPGSPEPEDRSCTNFDSSERYVVNCSQSTYCQTRTYRYHHHQGDPLNSQVHSLPSLESSQNRLRRNSKANSLDVGSPQQRVIGSPAPAALRRANERHRRKKLPHSASGEFPSITLSACEDDSDEEEEEEEGLEIQRDKVLDVGEVGSCRLGGHSRLGSSRSYHSISSIHSLVELHMNRSGLTPPPRVISMRDANTGAEVVTEWQSQHSLRSVSADSSGPPERERLPPKSTLPALPKSGQGSAGSQEGGGLPSKYPTLEPIKGRDRSRRRKTHKTY